MKNKTKNNLKVQLLSCADQFIARNPRFTESSRYNDRAAIFPFVAYLIKTPITSNLPIKIKQETIIKWLKKEKAGHSLITTLHYMLRVAIFLSFLEKRGILKENPLAVLKKKYPKKGITGIFLALLEPCPQKSLQALKPSSRFASLLGPSMQKFIALHRSLGKKYHTEEYELCSFDRFLRSHSNPPKQLSDEVVRQWLDLLQKYPQKNLQKNFHIVRQFCLYLQRFDPTVYVPASSIPYKPSTFIPHIYSRAEIGAILKAARQLKPTPCLPLRPHMIYLLYSLLYTTGIRISEALKLRLDDIDWERGTLYIRETKFHKSRLIPLSHSMLKQLKHYIQLSRKFRRQSNGYSPLFQNIHTQKSYSIISVQYWFRKMLIGLGLKLSTQGRNGPRIHDLRHTFACHRLEEWYRKKVDVQSKLEWLSTYMGHSKIKSTQHYLTMTPELLKQASQRFKQYFNQKQKDSKCNE